MNMKRYIWLMVLLILPSTLLFAQEVVDRTVYGAIPNAGHYVVAIIAGFVLAVAFQLILTNLSVAAGLGAASTVTDPDKVRKSSGGKSSAPDEGNTVGESVRMVSSAFGVWTLITATIALFFASWLAAELSLTADATVGAVLGLVVWGLFYVAMMTIEVNALSSLVGSLIRLASSGLRTAYNATSSMFTKSDQAKVEDTAARVTSAVKEEIFGTADSSDIKDQLKDYLKQLKPRDIDPREFAAGFAEMLNNTEIRAIVQENHSWDTETVYAQLRSHGMEEKGARKLASKSKDILSVIKEERGKDKSLADKVIDGSMKAAGIPENEVRETRQKFEDYLRRSGREELDPDAIKADLERLFSDPKGASRSLKDRFAHVDRETISSALSANGNMSKEEINKRTNQIYSVIEKIKTGTTDFKESIIRKMRDYMDSLDNPDLRYDDVAQDVQKLFHDPKAGAEALMHRIKSVDRETIKHMLSYRKDISEEDAERIISKVEMARDNVKGKVEQMQSEIKRRINDAKVEAVHQADEVRKTAATAAWWAFATAIISGIGAVMGGLIATNSF
jgi:hypothetical protein